MPIQLNYDIQDPHERTAYVQEALDHYLEPLSEAEIERLANYILCGRGDSPNPIERGEVIAPTSRHNTYAQTESKNVSLDALLETSTLPIESQICPWGGTSRRRNPIRRPYRRPDGTIDPGDSTIPGMVDLWKQIDELERRKQTETDTYAQYKIKHVLIDLQRQQYELRDSYNPPISHSAVASTTINAEPHINFDSDSGYWISEEEWRRKLANSYNPRLSRNIEDYETKVTPTGVYVKWIVRKQKFDWESPAHVRALMENYDLLMVQDGDKPDTQGYALLKDFQYYRKIAKISRLRDYILERRLAHASYGEIRAEVADKWGIEYNSSYLCRILTQELPRTIAQAATTHRLLSSTPDSECKLCPKCGRRLPRHPLFFGMRHDEEDGYTKMCRDCTRLTLNKEQIDRRYKDKSHIKERK